MPGNEYLNNPKDEAETSAKQLFNMLDIDNDGDIDETEFIE